MQLSFAFVDPPEDRLKKDLPPIILLHGIMDSKLTWSELAPDLANATRRKVYYLDARNHGDSPWSNDFTTDILVDDVEEFMRSNFISKAILVGHSLGGRTAISLALKRPEIIEKLIVEDMTPKDFSTGLVASEEGDLIVRMMKLFKEAVEAIPEGSSDRKARLSFMLYLTPLVPPEMLPKTKQSMNFQMKILAFKKDGDRYVWKTNMDALLEALSKDCCFVQNLQGSFPGESLFLSGNESFINVTKDSDYIRKLFPNSKIEVLEGASHLIHHQVPQMFLKKVIDFINAPKPSEATTGSDSQNKMQMSFGLADPPQEDLKKGLPPILLLHGMMDSKLTWAQLAPQMANATGRKVYYLDARNHGDSPWSEDFNIDILVDDVKEFMKSKSISRAILVGHSMGGRTAITLALQEPGKVEKLIVEDMTTRDLKTGTLAAQGGGIVVQMLRLMRDALEAIPEGSNERKAKLSLAMYLSPLVPPEMMPKSKKDMMFQMDILPLKKVGDRYVWKTNLDVLEKALVTDCCFIQNLQGSFPGEALFLSGGESFINVSRDSDSIRKLFPNSELETLEGATHLIHYQFPQIFLQKVVDFINGPNSSDFLAAEKSKNKLALSYSLVEPSAESQRNASPIILLHDMIATKHSWSRLAPKIANYTGRKVYLVDARNHGDSPYSDVFNVEVLTDDIENFMLNHNIPKAILVGHGLGGKAALTLAIRQPQKVEKLVVEDTSPKNFSPADYKFLNMVIKKFQATVEDISPQVDERTARSFLFDVMEQPLTFENNSNPESETAIENTDLQVNRDGEEKSPLKYLEKTFKEIGSLDQRLDGQYPNNTLFIFGTKSYFKVSEDEPIIKKHFPHAQMMPIEGAGHLVHFTHESRFLQELVNFINDSPIKSDTLSKL